MQNELPLGARDYHEDGGEMIQPRRLFKLKAKRK
jgi:hypothetical protein